MKLGRSTDIGSLLTQLTEKTTIQRVEIGQVISKGDDFTCLVRSMNDDINYTCYYVIDPTDEIVRAPSDGAFVMVITDDDMNKYVTWSSEISSHTTITTAPITYHTTSAVTFKADNTSFNGDNYGGLIIIQKLVDKINALEQRMYSHQHIYSVNGAPAITIPDSSTNPTITPTTVKDIENPDIKHGDTK